MARNRSFVATVSPVSIVRHETWTYNKATAPKAVSVVAHRDTAGRFAAGRFGNGARRSR